MADSWMRGIPTLDGKVALVLGASKGIGEAIVRALAGNGASVMLASRNIGLMQKIGADLNNAAIRVRIVATDVTDAGSVENAVSETVRTFGRLDIAVNNAGVQIPRVSFIDLTADQFDQVMNVNLRGVFLAMKYELRAMLHLGSGSIVNISSVGGLVGLPQIAPYIASKHAVIGLTKSAALEYAAKGIRVNAVAPGPTMTDLFRIGPASTPQKLAAMTTNVPMGRIADPDEIAGAVVWLCTPAASFVTGITVPVDGGFTAP